MSNSKAKQEKSGVPKKSNTHGGRLARSGPRCKELIVKSAIEAARLVDDSDVQITSLAIVAGVDVSVMSRRVDDGREIIAQCPMLRSPLTTPDMRYLEARYRDSRDPALREWLKTIQTRRRKRG